MVGDIIGKPVGELVGKLEGEPTSRECGRGCGRGRSRDYSRSSSPPKFPGCLYSLETLPPYFKGTQRAHFWYKGACVCIHILLTLF